MRISLILIAVIFFLGFFLRMENAFFDDPLYTDENGLQYFQESDSYYNYRLTENIVTGGHMGDAVIDGMPWDLHSYYPPGVPLDYPPLLPIMASTLYALISAVAPVSLREICLLMPAFTAPLAGIICFLIVRKFYGNFPGFVAGILIVSAPFYLIKTVYGFYDTDMLVITVPLTTLLFLVEAECSEKNRIPLSSCAGLFLFLFSITWSGWQIMFYILFAAFLVCMVVFRNSENMKDIVEVFIPAFTVLFVLLILLNRLELIKLVMAPLRLPDLMNHSLWYPWPDSYTTVAELQPASPDKILRYISPVLIIMGGSGIPLYLIRGCDSAPEILIIIISLWVLTGVLMLMKGVRFIMFLIPPLSISAGILTGMVTEYSSTTFKKIKMVASSIIMALVLVQVFISWGMLGDLKPGYDDYFEESANWIAENTSRDSVIVTEWSYGHFYTSEADRPVLYDGRLAYIETLPARNLWYGPSIDPRIPLTARDYWISRALSSGNTTLSVNILRMLSNSGDEAYLLIENYTGDSVRSLKIMREILSLNRSQARELLVKKYSFHEEEALRVVSRTHPLNSREIVMVIPDQMISEVAVRVDRNCTLSEDIFSRIWVRGNHIEEEIINPSGKRSLVEMDGGMYLMNRKYRNSLLLRLLLGVHDDRFMLVYENPEIKVYVLQNS
ncbi:dolichyl-diphosphooligosaccharide--protein glycosyltransferase subunit STT3 [Methanothermobacter sp. K4]|nr:dolichyl-diphosphooligosaccharide--protein glycosyltransferase subunit STT3 [Methanothermobacter sp. K4]